MPTIHQRATFLTKRLLNIRVGSGAIRLPHHVKRIDLRFAQKAEGGHLGARKLWRNELIRMKYHNPAVPFTLDRAIEQTEPATLSIYFASKDAPQTSDSEMSSAAATGSTSENSTMSAAAPTEEIVKIDVTGKANDEILQAIIDATKAKIIEPDAEDKGLMEDVVETDRRSAAARALMAQVRAKAKRERDLLQQARSSM